MVKRRLKGSLSTSVLCRWLLLFSSGTVVWIASDGKRPTSFRTIISSHRITQECIYNRNSRLRIEGCPQFKEDQLIGMFRLFFPQPTFEKHRSYGPVLQEGFYPGKSRVCTINNNSFIIHWKASLILPKHQSCSKIWNRVCSPILSEKWLCTSTIWDCSTKWKIDWSPFLYMTRLATGRDFILTAM